MKGERKMSQPLRILIVEDSQDDAFLVIQALKKGDYNATYERVEDAEGMKSALKDGVWDLVLCDYSLPSFNALAAQELLKETGIDIPFIIVSGTIGEETAVEAMRLGAQDYIMKDRLARLAPAVERELKDARVRSEHRKAEKELRESERKLSTVFQYSPVSMAIGSLDEGRLLDVNEQYLSITGFSREELIGHRVAELNLWVDPGDRKKVVEALSTNQGSISSYPVSIRTKSGEIREVLFSADIIRINDVPCLLSSALDVTEHRRMEKRLQASEEEYRRLFENSVMGISEALPDGRLTRANRAYAHMYGYASSEEVIAEVTDIGQQLYANPEDRKEVLRVLGEQGRMEPREFLVTRRDGSPFYALVGAQEIRDASGTLNRYQATHVDITDRKKADMDLLEAERRYRSIFENAQEGIYRSIPQGRFIMANPAMARILGYDSPEELISCITDIASQVFVDPRERSNVLQRIEKETILRNHEVRQYRKDGSIAWISLTNHAIRDEQGAVLYYEGIAVDVTDRKESIERLRKALSATVQAIAVMVETRDPYTAGHQRRVADLARSIASEMNLSCDQIDGMRMAGIIHDLGKISVPAEILSKPTKLTDIEFSLIKTHPQSGYAILKDIDFPWPIARMVLEHHEWMNGSGYPHGVRGEKLLIESRILTVADVVEAMASHRPYRPSLGIDAALVEIEKNKGILYDDAAVEACLRLFREKGFELAVA
jgi:PAS domain S-box-containing protein